VSENRPRYWHAAWADYGQHPVLGSGAGTYYIYWLRKRDISSFTREAHNVYLETLAELGPLGLVLVLATLAAPMVALKGRSDPAVVVPGAAYVAFLFHAAVEWDWEQPAVMLVGITCGAAMLAAVRSEEAPALSAKTRAVVLAAAVAVAALSLERLAHGPRLPFIA
jgi:O-Antigen ligase